MHSHGPPREREEFPDDREEGPCTCSGNECPEHGRQCPRCSQEPGFQHEGPFDRRGHGMGFWRGHSRGRRHCGAFGGHGSPFDVNMRFGWRGRGGFGPGPSHPGSSMGGFRSHGCQCQFPFWGLGGGADPRMSMGFDWNGPRGGGRGRGGCRGRRGHGHHGMGMENPMFFHH